MKYLIFIFVLVFDPLAICLVIASSQAINSRSLALPVVARRRDEEQQPEVQPAPPVQASTPAVAATTTVLSTKEINPFENAEIIEMVFEDAEEIKKLS